MIKQIIATYATVMLSDHGYEGDEMLMNPKSGSVAAARSWAIESFDWYDCERLDECRERCDCLSVNEQFASLIPVIKTESGHYEEI